MYTSNTTQFPIIDMQSSQHHQTHLSQLKPIPPFGRRLRAALVSFCLCSLPYPPFTSYLCADLILPICLSWKTATGNVCNSRNQIVLATTLTLNTVPTFLRIKSLMDDAEAGKTFHCFVSFSHYVVTGSYWPSYSSDLHFPLQSRLVGHWITEPEVGVSRISFSFYCFHFLLLIGMVSVT